MVSVCIKKSHCAVYTLFYLAVVHVKLIDSVLQFLWNGFSAVNKLLISSVTQIVMYRGWHFLQYIDYCRVWIMPASDRIAKYRDSIVPGDTQPLWKCFRSHVPKVKLANTKRWPEVAGGKGLKVSCTDHLGKMTYKIVPINYRHVVAYMCACQEDLSSHICTV